MRSIVLAPLFIATLVTGCAGDRSDFNPPAYQVQSADQSATDNKLHQAIEQTPAIQSAPPARTEAQPGVLPGPATVPQAAPSPQPEQIPVSPGPDYVWMPGYWTVGVGGGWVWVGGHYVLRRSVSEEQLRAARGMLEQSRTSLTGRALKDVDKAIDQVNEALHEYRVNNP